jgi:hypothetical protein
VQHRLGACARQRRRSFMYPACPMWHCCGDAITQGYPIMVLPFICRHERGDAWRAVATAEAQHCAQPSSGGLWHTLAPPPPPPAPPTGHSALSDRPPPPPPHFTFAELTAMQIGVPPTHSFHSTNFNSRYASNVSARHVTAASPCTCSGRCPRPVAVAANKRCRTSSCHGHASTLGGRGGLLTW